MESFRLTEKVIDQALSLGAQECEVLLDKGQSLSLKTNLGKLEEHKVSQTHTLGIRLKKDGRMGMSYSENFDDDSITVLLKSALESSRYNKISENENILCNSDSNQVVDATNPLTWKEDSSTDQEKIDTALHLESGVRSQGPIFKSAPYNGLSEAESERFIANHLGLKKTVKHRLFSAFTSALAEENNNQAMFWHSSSGLNLKDLDVDACIKTSCKHSQNLLLGTPVKTGYYPIIFSTDALAELWSCFLSIFSAKSAIDKTNPWSQKIGEPVASPLLNLVDQPNHKGGLSWQAWDDEGYESKPVDLIKEGVLTGFLHNSSTASELKQPNNGRASRGPRQSLNVSPTHLVFKNGNLKESELRSGQYLELILLQGLHSGVEVMSGDFSFGASGYLMNGSEVSQVVRNITVSGNFYELLNQVDGLTDNIRPNSSYSFFSPLVRFKKLSIGGT